MWADGGREGVCSGRFVLVYVALCLLYFVVVSFGGVDVKREHSKWYRQCGLVLNMFLGLFVWVHISWVVLLGLIQPSRISFALLLRILRVGTKEVKLGVYEPP